MVNNKQPSRFDRTRKTQKNLADALIKLITDMDYESIRIKTIIDHARVGRSTFYAHYESKEHLLTGNIYFQDLLLRVANDDQETYPMGLNLSGMFNCAKKHMPMIKTLMGTRCMAIFSDYLADLFVAQIMAANREKQGNTPLNELVDRYKAEAVGAGLVKMAVKWLADGAVVPVEEMLQCTKVILHIGNCTSY